jgi:raffinose/stachyose/melibiose transport system substrate-binding protein
VRLRTITIFAGTALLVTACSSSGGGTKATGTAAANAAVHISFINIPPDTGTELTVFKYLMNQFKKTHPGSTLDVTDVPQDQLDQKLQLLSSQNDLPDMFFGPGTPAAQKQMCEKGLALDIGATAAKLGSLDAFSPAAVQILKSQQGGKLCAIPFQLNIEGFWYNKKLFSDNGLTPPATWDDLVSDADTLNSKGIQPFASSGKQGWPLTRLVSGYLYRDLGPSAMQDVASGKAKLTDSEYVKAASAVADLGSKNYFGKGVASLDYAPAENVFLQGDAGMYYMGSWALADFNNPKLNKIGVDNIGFFPFPAVSGGKGSVDQTPSNAGQPIMVSAKKYSPAEGQWLKFVFDNYGNAALSQAGALSGFKVTKTPASLPPTTQLAINQIKAIKTPVLWFEALMGAKQTSLSQTNAARLVTGTMSAKDFMSTVQAAKGS